MSFVLATSFGAMLGAQCQSTWLPSAGFPGTDEQAFDVVQWDPDGSGPAGELVVVGGRFFNAGPAATPGIATWNPGTGQWGTIGGGVVGHAWAIVPGPDGDLWCAVNGYSTSFPNHVTYWDGSGWQQLGGDFDGYLRDLIRLPNGDLVAAGAFANVGSVAANGLARWDGQDWHPYGTGVTNDVRALLVTAAGELVIGGTFATVDGVAANCIARFDGTTWTPFGSGMNPVGFDGPYALAEMPNGDIIAGGFFPQAGGVVVSNIARWNGSTWNALGNGLNTAPLFGFSVYSLEVLASGELLVGGTFSSAAGQPLYCIARWTGSQWFALGTGFPDNSFSSNHSVRATTQMRDGTLIACGDFEPFGGQLGKNIARFSGSVWRSLSPGVDDNVLCMKARGNGELLVGGQFAVAGVAANHIASWNGSQWSALGAGTNDEVRAIDELPNGDVIAGGDFLAAGGVLANRIARWDGNAWSALGAGINGSVRAVVAMPDGEVICAGAFLNAGGVPASNVARWDGSTWHALGAGISGSVAAAALLPDGDVVFVGNFSSAGGVNVGNVARWNGVSFQPMGTVGNAFDVEVGPDGTVYVATGFGVVEWDGAGWLNLGSATLVWSLQALPSGDLVASGDFTTIGGVPASHVARWNGSSWSPIGAGLDLRAQALAFLPVGELALGGIFTMADGAISPHFARISTSCPSTIVATGSGCLAADTMTILERAWLGGRLRSRSSGLSAPAIAVAVTGFQSASVPLSSVLAQALPGCDLLASPDLSDAALAGSGSVGFALAIPAGSQLLGLPLHHQHVVIELGVGSRIVAVRTTNAAEITIGSF